MAADVLLIPDTANRQGRRGHLRVLVVDHEPEELRHTGAAPADIGRLEVETVIHELVLKPGYDRLLEVCGDIAEAVRADR